MEYRSWRNTIAEMETEIDTQKVVPDNVSVLEQEVEVGDAGEEEMDDLFGDEDDNDNDNDNVEGEKKSAISVDVEGDDDEEEEVEGEEEEEAEEIKQADLTVERHPRSHEPKDNHAYSFPLPRFLFVDPTPFTPNVFEQQLKEFITSNNLNNSDINESTLKSSIQFKKLQLTNTVRWRYAKSKTNELFKQSNANIIEWEDGSMSLKLGNEYFDIKTKPNDDNLLAFRSGQALVSLMNMDKSIQILPPSMKSRAHQILADTLTKNMKMKKSKRINTIVTNEDPELKAREVERAQREIEKARRRQMMKLQMEEERSERRSGSGSGTRFRDSVDGYDDDIDIGEGDEYDDDDDDGDYGNGGGSGKSGFVVDDDDEGSELDDDELDRAAERLKKVKRDGAARYREDSNGSNNNRNGSHDAGDVKGDEDDEDAVVRKKRKIVLDDDDDE